MRKIFQILMYTLVLAQYVQAQTKKSAIKHQPIALKTKSLVSHQLAVITKSSPHSLDKKLLATSINQKLRVYTFDTGSPNILKIEVKAPTKEPFVVYLTDQDQMVHFRKHFIDTNKADITVYFKENYLRKNYILHIISPIEHIKKIIALN